MLKQRHTLGVPLEPFARFSKRMLHLSEIIQYFGVTAPLDGFRYRIGVEQYLGDFSFTAVTADVRKYWRVKPVTFAARSYNYLRVGRDGENLYPSICWI
jgi:hypothetical protein